MKVSLLFSTKNEAGAIGRLLKEVPQDIVDEIIIIDGHSTDATAKEARLELRPRQDKFIVQKEPGYGRGVIQGLKSARGDIIIIICGDGSDDPKYLKDFLTQIKSGYDYVRASRYMKGGKSEDDTLFTRTGNKIFTFLTNLVHRLKVSDSLYIYSAITRRGLKKIILTSPGFEITLELLIKAHRSGLKCGSLPVVERKRYSGRPKINPLIAGLKMLPVIFRRYDSE